MIRNLIYILFFTISLFIFWSCANVGSPAGGPRDVIPPQIVKENPKNNLTNYFGKEFEVTFDEFVRLNNFSEQVMVTPSLKYKPQAKLKGKKIIFSFKDTLASNTTYTFYMGESIMDITEGNKVPGYKYVFSTGNYIDSLQLKGNVINAFDLAVMDKTWVMLYSKNIDSLVYTQTPYYVTKTDASGNFTFTNLKDAEFYIAALKEENGNYLLDMPTEKVGFIKNSVRPMIADTLGNVPGIISMKVFEEKQSKQFLKKSITGDYGKIKLIFNIPVSQFHLKEIKDAEYSDKILIETGINKDTITLWLPEIVKDSLFLEISDGKKYADTLELPLLKKTTKRRGGKTVAEELAFSCMVNRENTTLDLNKFISIEFFRPTASVDTSLIKITQDKKVIKPSFIFTDSLKRMMKIPLKLEEKQIVNLEFLPGAFTDILGLTNDTIKKELKTRDIEYYGNLIATIHVSATDTAQFIIQLINDKGVVSSEVFCHQDTVIKFNYLSPGTYKLKSVYDLNKNGVWDTGVYLTRTMPEDVFFYKEPIIIRSNWDVEIDWKL